MLPAKTKTKTNPTTTTTTTKTATKTTAERSTPAAKTPKGSDPKSQPKLKSRSKAAPQPQAKSEADPPDDPSPSSVPVLFSEAWKNIWAATAAATGSIVLACEAAGVTLAEYAAARRADLEFDAVCCVRDEVADLKITESLCAGAMGGDIRFQSLYFAKVRDLILGADRTERAEACLSAAEAEAALRATLTVREGAARAKEVAMMVPPSLSPSRPEAKSSRDSARRTPT